MGAPPLGGAHCRGSRPSSGAAGAPAVSRHSSAPLPGVPACLSAKMAAGMRGAQRRCGGCTRRCPTIGLRRGPSPRTYTAQHTAAKRWHGAPEGPDFCHALVKCRVAVATAGYGADAPTPRNKAWKLALSTELKDERRITPMEKRWSAARVPDGATARAEGQPRQGARRVCASSCIFGRKQPDPQHPPMSSPTRPVAVPILTTACPVCESSGFNTSLPSISLLPSGKSTTSCAHRSLARKGKAAVEPIESMRARNTAIERRRAMQTIADFSTLSSNSKGRA